MSTGETAPRRPAELALTAGVFAAVFAALLPLIRVVTDGPWLPGAVALAGAILATGYVARWFRLPAVAVSLLEAVVWVALVTVFFLRDTALLAVVPTPETFRVVRELVVGGFAEIQQGAAPLTPTTALSFFIVAAMGVLAIVIDHVVVTARMPLLAAVALIAISLIPSLATPGAVNMLAFVLLAASILFLLRAEMRARDASAATRVRTRVAAHGVAATAVAIGAIGVVVALVATPLLPRPVPVAGGIGAGASIDPSLQLGDDLRKPSDTEVLRVHTNAPTAPYLRVVTLTQFDGSVWEPDRSRTLPLGSARSFAPVRVDDGIATNEYTTNVQVKNLVTSWLPVAFPAVNVSGLDGDWGAVSYNRTVVSRTGSSQGQDYEVVTQQPRPTLEQIRARSAGGDEATAETLQLPAGLPAIISETAAEATGASSTDYDKLHDLQTWFRSSAFTYSLDAPVEEGFDGSGTDAVASFLQVRSGYCVHYASAFAIMARTLGMPSRIVVGYLPGTTTGESVDAQPVFSVLSGQLHAWPEVFFEGVGWVPFEPTNSLGVPTDFASSSRGGTPGEAARESAAPSPTPAPASSLDAADDGSQPTDVQAGGAARSSASVPPAAVLLAILIALALPALLRVVMRRRLMTAARRGDAAAAWRSVQDDAIDIGMAVPGSESPRMLAARLIAENGVDPAAMTVLVRAIERASYAPTHQLDPERGDEVADAAASVRSQLLASGGLARQVLSWVAPRSLIVRPGSVYAASAGRPRVR